MDNILLYEGKAKSVYSTVDPDVLRLVYLDQATALNGKKKDVIMGKGALNNQITSLVFDYLSRKKVPHHWLNQVSSHEQLVKRLTIVPMEVVVRNVSAGSFSRRLGITEGKDLPNSIIEYYYKDDDLDDPFINESHIAYLDLATENEVAQIERMARSINDYLIELFKACNLTLVDFKLEFGRLDDGSIVLADEITPDTCRLWDTQTKASLDKDIYRHDKGDLIPIYQEVLQRLQTLKENDYV